MTRVSPTEAPTMGTAASVSESENVEVASQTQTQDNLRIFLKHLYAECVYRYQNVTYDTDDPSVSLGAATGEWLPPGVYVICRMPCAHGQ